MRYSLSLEKEDIYKAMGFYLLLKILVKTSVVSIVKNLLTVLKSLQQMQ